MSQRRWLRDPQKESFWRRMIAQQQQSGLNIREFCRREKLPEHNFHAWKRTLAQRDADEHNAQPADGSDPRQPPPPQPQKSSTSAAAHSPAHSPAFVPLSLVSDPNAGRLEIVWPQGPLFRLPLDVDGPTLCRLLNVLQEHQAPAETSHLER